MSRKQLHAPRTTQMWSGRFREPLNRAFEQWQRSFRVAWLLLLHGVGASKTARALVFTSIFSFWLPNFSPAQQATVTFYTHGSTLTTGLPGSKHGVFSGGVFFDRKLLFAFREGYLAKNDRRLTLNVPAGEHTLAASYSKGAAEKDFLSVRIESGKHYFFRAQSSSKGVIQIEFDRGHLEQVTCEIATKELSDSKVLHPKDQPPALAAMEPADQSLSACP